MVEEHRLPEVHLDYAFLRRVDSEVLEQLVILKANPSRAMQACIVPSKGLGDQASAERVLKGIRAMGIRPPCVFKCDGEASAEALREAVMARLTEEVMAALAPLSTYDMGSIVRTALATYYGQLRANPNEARVFLVEILGVSPKMDTIYWDTIRQVSLSILRFAPDAAERAKDRGLDLDLFADGLIGAVVQIALGWVRSGYAAPIDTVVETAMAILGAVNREYLSPRA